MNLSWTVHELFMNMFKKLTEIEQNLEKWIWTTFELNLNNIWTTEFEQYLNMIWTVHEPFLERLHELEIQISR